ncbi:hypothetical protein ACTMS0_03515 [Micromonospora sp. H33]
MRIRQARAEDSDAVTALSRLAGVDIEVEVMDAVRIGTAGTVAPTMAAVRVAIASQRPRMVAFVNGGSPSVVTPLHSRGGWMDG